MHPRISFALVFLLLAVVAQAAGAAEPEPATLHPARLRGFAVESPTAVVVREGRGHFRRVVLAGPCPALAMADTLDFQIGGGAVERPDRAGAPIPVVRDPAPAQVSSQTRHLHLLVGRTSGPRTACPVARIERADRVAFDAAGVPPSARDDRRDAAGR